MTHRRMYIVLAVPAAALGAAVVASAAALGVVPARLTSHDAAASVSPSTCTLSAPVADSYVDAAAPLSNFGSSTDLLVRSFLAADRRTFVRFDLSSCAIPATARVTAATLSLFMSQSPTSNRTYEARRVTASWVESTVTSSNQPAVAAAATSSTTTGTTSNVTLSWSVTADAQSFVTGSATNNGWRLADGSAGALLPVDALFGARERAIGSERPGLVVTYYP